MLPAQKASPGWGPRVRCRPCRAHRAGRRPALARGRHRSRAMSPRSSADRSPQSEGRAARNCACRPESGGRGPATVLVLGFGPRFGWSGLVARDPDACSNVIAPELAREGADHRKIDPPSRGRRRAPAASASGLQMAGVSGDRVAIRVGDRGRPAKLVPQPVTRTSDKSRSTGGASTGSPHARPRAPLGRGEQVELRAPPQLLSASGSRPPARATPARHAPRGAEQPRRRW